MTYPLDKFKNKLEDLQRMGQEVKSACFWVIEGSHTKYHKSEIGFKFNPPPAILQADNGSPERFLEYLRNSGWDITDARITKDRYNEKTIMVTLQWR